MTHLCLDRAFVALADSGRRAMVDRLSSGPATGKVLAEAAGLRLPSAVKHLKVLQEGGILASTKTGRSRTYRLETRALQAIGDWARSREASWNTAFDRLTMAMREND